MVYIVLLKDQVFLRKEVLMKRRTGIFFILTFFLVVGWAASPPMAPADFEWRILKDLDLTTAPLDVAPSADGQRLFILTAGEILIYSIPDEKITDRIPVDKDFDRIASLPRADTLTITSSGKKALQIIVLESVYKIDVTGLPFKGPQDAAVTVAVFTDYQ
jgi:hypothetical protein